MINLTCDRCLKPLAHTNRVTNVLFFSDGSHEIRCGYPATDAMAGVVVRMHHGCGPVGHIKTREEAYTCDSRYLRNTPKFARQ